MYVLEQKEEKTIYTSANPTFSIVFTGKFIASAGYLDVLS